jgi:hypothetical protein
LTELNENIIANLGEFLNHFSSVELRSDNILENLLIIKLFYEIVLNFLNNIEYPARLVLVLLRADGNEVLNKINEKYHIFYKTFCENDDKVKPSWNEYFSLYESLCKILDKFKMVIKEEGSSIKFSRDNEVGFFLILAAKNY